MWYTLFLSRTYTLYIIPRKWNWFALITVDKALNVTLCAFKEAWRADLWKWHVNQMSVVYFQARFANNYCFDPAPQLTKETCSLWGAGNQLFKCSCVWRVEGKARRDCCTLQRGSDMGWFHTSREKAVEALNSVFALLTCADLEGNVLIKKTLSYTLNS